MKKRKLKKHPKKLQLHRETIKTLEEGKLKPVVGGATSPFTRCGESFCFC